MQSTTEPPSGRCPGPRGQAIAPRVHLPAAAALVLVLAYGVGLRGAGLATTPLWSDEAESCVNALAILEHGVPVGTYQGQPVYENTLVRPWPEHPEYEFRDSSYGENGLAVYHGWLPLYAVAASFRLGGVTPDAAVPAGEPPRVRHSAAEMRNRTALGRLPAVLFSVLFLLAAFGAGRAMYGPDAGWAALAAAAVCTPAVEFGREARYYSATLALATCCCWATWAMLCRGRWRDAIGAAVAFALLFHTHLLSFAVAGGILAAVGPALLRRPGAVPKLVMFAAVVAAATVPWLVLSGFLTATAGLPPARSLFAGPGDWLAYPLAHWPLTAVVAAALAWTVGANQVVRRLPPGPRRRRARSFAAPFVRHRGALVFLAAWVLLGFVAFTVTMPAASYFARRVTLAVLGPGLLFAAMAACGLARAVAGGRPSARSALIGCAVVVGCLGVTSRATFAQIHTPGGRQNVYDVVEAVRGWDVRPGTRLYAMPNEHLVLAFYTGLPVQSSAPVRKSFFDAYPGDVVVFEAGPRHELLPLGEVRRLAAAAGQPLARAAAEELRRGLPYQLLRADAGRHAARVTPVPLWPTDPWVGPLLDAQRRHTRAVVAAKVRRSGNPMFRGYDLPDHSYWWQVFFYRFVNPERRTGPALNYADRVRTGEARLLPNEWVAYVCPGPPGDPPAPGHPPADGGRPTMLRQP